MSNSKQVTITGILHTGADNFVVAATSDGRIAYLFNPDKVLRPSASGKTTLVSTTSGALKIPGLPTMSVNVYK